jgi:hypothetical protein
MQNLLQELEALQGRQRAVRWRSMEGHGPLVDMESYNSQEASIESLAGQEPLGRHNPPVDMEFCGSKGPADESSVADIPGGPALLVLHSCLLPLQ